MAPRRPCSRGGSQCRVASWPNKARKALVSELRSCCSPGVLAVLHSDYHNSWRELHTTVALEGGLASPHCEWLCRARHCAQGGIGCINVHSKSSASSRRPPCFTFCLCHCRPWSPRSIDSEKFSVATFNLVTGFAMQFPRPSALQNSWILYPGIFLDSNPGVSRKVGEFVGAAGSNAGVVRQRIRASRIAACHRLPQGVG